MKEELKQAIEEVAYPMYAKAPNQSEADADYLKDVSFNSMLVAVSTPSILRHADPEIMKQAGWVREDDLKRLVLGAAKYGFNYRDISQHSGYVPHGNVLQWLQNQLSNLNNKP